MINPNQNAISWALGGMVGRQKSKETAAKCEVNAVGPRQLI